MKNLAFAFTAAILLATNGQAQQVGQIERIADRSEKEITETPDARLVRTGNTQPARKDADLFRNDLMQLLRSGIVVNLRFEREQSDTRVYLGSRKLAAEGTYRIEENTTEALGRLQLVVVQGVMVIEHATGELMTIAANIRVRIFGTTVLFQVDESGTEGFLYLSEGHISFPDFGIDASGTDRAWRLQSGLPPVEIDPGRQMRRRWRREIQYNTASVWQATPFWQKPGFYIPATVAAVGLAVGIVASTSGDDGPVEGDVVITLPD